MTETSPSTAADSTAATGSDADLVRRSKRGDVAALESIMRRYNQPLYRLARSIVGDDAEAMDVVQDAYFKAFTRLTDFRGPDGLATWLYTITRNEALMSLRKRRNLVLVSDAPPGAAEPVTTRGPEDHAANDQLERLLEASIDRLPGNFRIVFVLRAIEKLSVAETAKILAVPERTVRTRYFRARRMLRRQFDVHLDRMGLEVYEFGGRHCDRITQAVLDRLAAHHG